MRQNFLYYFISQYISQGERKKRYNNFSFFNYRAALGCMLLGGGLLSQTFVKVTIFKDLKDSSDKNLECILDFFLLTKHRIFETPLRVINIRVQCRRQTHRGHRDKKSICSELCTKDASCSAERGPYLKRTDHDACVSACNPSCGAAVGFHCLSPASLEEGN